MNLQEFSQMFDLVGETVLSVDTHGDAISFKIETDCENEYHANGYRPTLEIHSVHTYTFTHQNRCYDIPTSFSIIKEEYNNHILTINDIVLEDNPESQVIIL